MHNISEIIYLPDALSITAGEVALPAAGQLEAPGVGAAFRAAGGVVPLYQPGVGAQGVAGEGGLSRGANPSVFIIREKVPTRPFCGLK